MQQPFPWTWHSRRVFQFCTSSIYLQIVNWIVIGSGKFKQKRSIFVNDDDRNSFYDANDLFMT